MLNATHVGPKVPTSKGNLKQSSGGTLGLKFDHFYVRVVEAHKGGKFTHGQDIQFTSKRGAQEAAERLQEDFDEDCEPKRVYVLGQDFVPIDAAGKSRMPPIKSIRRG